MARRPKSRPARRPAARPAARANGSNRDRIVAAFMELLAEEPVEKIELAAIAKRAGVSLSELRSEFNSPLAILGAHVKAIDRAVLAGGDVDLADEPPRERLFDVLMRRLELL